MSATPVSEKGLPDGLFILLKTGGRMLVNACAVQGQTGPQRVEQLTGYSQGVISRWVNENYPVLMPLEVVGILEASTGKPIVTRMLASLSGFQLQAAGEGEGAAADIMGDVMRITGSHARFTATASEAWEDQKLTPGEVKALIQSGMAHVDQMTALLSRLAKMAGG